MIYLLLIPMVAFLVLWLKARDDMIWLKQHNILILKVAATMFISGVDEGDCDEIVKMRDIFHKELQ